MTITDYNVLIFVKNNYKTMLHLYLFLVVITNLKIDKLI